MPATIERGAPLSSVTSPARRFLAVPGRFNGLPGRANGGYIAGRISRYVGAPAEVTIRQPVPLETRLELTVAGGEAWLARQECPPMVVARQGKLHGPAPAPPLLTSQVQRQPVECILPQCFVCGGGRPPGNGMGLAPCRLPGELGVAAPFVAAAHLAASDGTVRDEFAWAALDCTAAYAVSCREQPAVLGRMTALIERPLAPFVRYVVYSWWRGVEGRKRYAGSAIATESSEIVARAESTWIEVAPFPDGVAYPS